MANILIVDDDKLIRLLLAEEFSGLGHDVAVAATLAQAMALASSSSCDLVYLDVQMPDGSGLDFIRRLKESPGEPEVVILTGHGSPDGAELAINSGAWDYIEKPPSLNKLVLTLERALAYHGQKAGRLLASTLDREGILGESRAIGACLDLVARAADGEASVLLSGETGVGKELFARAVHRNSPRSGAPFVVVDCAALAANLMESTLFGHQKGAYTGADRSSQGLLRAAHRGTLFLDEIGELPLDMQRKLLRALQEKSFRPVGGEHEVKSDFRVLAATNRDLEEMVRDGGFRRDLLYRLQAIHLELPPLRQRKGDIGLLAVHFCSELCRKNGTPRKQFSQDFFQALETHPWPGNVRELKNTMEWVISQAGDTTTLFWNHLPTNIRVELARNQAGKQHPNPGAPAMDYPVQDPLTLSLKEYRSQAADQAEAHYLNLLLEKHGQNPKEAQAISGLSKTRFYALLQKHDLSSK